MNKILLLVIALLAFWIHESQAKGNPSNGLDLEGRFRPREGGGDAFGVFKGTFIVESFDNPGEAGTKKGKLFGTVHVMKCTGADVCKDIIGMSKKNVPLTIASKATGRLRQLQGSCEILDLDLGPLDLDLLGLVIELNELELDITAVGGSGKLLGNLLCAIVGLLDGTNTLQLVLQSLINLINNLLQL